MHPRGAPTRGTRRRARRARDVLEFVRERGVAHPREVDAHFAHGTRDELLGRLVERDDAPARRHALPRPAARGAARQRHPHLRGARARAAARERGGAPRAASMRWSTWSSPSTRRCRRRASSTLVRRLRYARAAASAASSRAALAARARAARAARASTASTGTGRPTRTRARARRRRRARAPARAVRSGRLGPAPLRAALGLGVSLRGLHAGAASASSATTRCRCCGAIASSAGRNGSVERRPAAAARFGYVDRRTRRAIARSAAALDAELDGMRVPRRSDRRLRSASGFCRRPPDAPSGEHAGRDGEAAHQAAGPSATQPTRLGPTIWPAANTIVNAPMPAGHAAGGRLWRTSAVVDATSERNTRAEQQRPRRTTASGCALSTGSSVATASSAFSIASDSPPRKRCSRPAHSHDDAITAEAEQRVERDDRRRAQAAARAAA